MPRCLGLRKHRGCGKETGRERESWLGHGAQLREGHGMWLATGSTHSSAGAGRQTLAAAPVGLSHTHGQFLPPLSADERVIYEYISALALALQLSEEYS